MMEILNALNLEQLGTSGLFIGYLIWQLQGKEKLIKDVSDERKFWQEKAFDGASEYATGMAESTQVFKTAIEAIKS